MQPETKYASYLLRLWQMRHDTQTTWVASIQRPGTGERRSFSSVDALVHFLQSEFGDCAAPEADAPSTHEVDGVAR